MVAIPFRQTPKSLEAQRETVCGGDTCVKRDDRFNIVVGALPCGAAVVRLTNEAVILDCPRQHQIDGADRSIGDTLFKIGQSA